MIEEFIHRVVTRTRTRVSRWQDRRNAHQRAAYAKVLRANRAKRGQLQQVRVRITPDRYYVPEYLRPPEPPR